MYSFRIIEQSTSLNTTPMLVPHFVTTVDLFYTGWYIKALNVMVICMWKSPQSTLTSFYHYSFPYSILNNAWWCPLGLLYDELLTHYSGSSACCSSFPDASSSSLRLHIVWKLLKMSHLNFLILAFSTNFCPIKTDLSGNTVWPQASGFQKSAKMDHVWNF